MVCTQLGFRRGEARYAAHFGSGAGPVHVTHVSCLGSETHIHDCYLTFASEEPNVELCGHSSDVGVYCSGVPFTSLLVLSCRTVFPRVQDASFQMSVESGVVSCGFTSCNGIIRSWRALFACFWICLFACVRFVHG